jgi:hypothetical protein
MISVKNFELTKINKNYINNKTYNDKKKFNMIVFLSLITIPKISFNLNIFNFSPSYYSANIQTSIN